MAQKLDGATTVASTMRIAAMAGIHVFATGGIGGVHRGAERSFDISADMMEFAESNVAVVTAGAKAILDLALTLETLETLGVPVVGYGTDDFPAFYSRASGHAVPMRCDTPEEVANLMKAKWSMGLKGGIVVANPIPAEHEIQITEIAPVIEKAVAEAAKQNISGKNVTPFLLAKAGGSYRRQVTESQHRAGQAQRPCRGRNRQGLCQMNTQRRGRKVETGPRAIVQLPWKQPQLTLEPSAILTDDHLEAIHNESLRVLEEIGMDVIYAEAREILADAGAIVLGDRVRIGRDIVEEALKTPPSEFVFHARNPEHSIRIGGKWIAFAPVGGPPNCSDLDRGRRPGKLEDSLNFMKLAQFFNCVHTAGGVSVDALDVHASIRHLHLTRNKMVFTDKVPFASSTGRHRLLDSIEIVRMARGISHDQLMLEPSTYTVINTNSPLKLDSPMAMGIIEMARLNQVCVVTPFTLAGAMAPITLAGALVQQNAEALAGLIAVATHQPRRPLCLWRLHLECGHEIRRSRLRHAGIHEGLHRRRATGQTLQAALPHQQHQCGQQRRRAIGL